MIPESRGYPIQLTLTPGSTFIELNWTKVSISSFIKYVIVRSTDSIPDVPVEQLGGNNVITEIEDLDSTRFRDKIILTVEADLFYKIYAQTASRTLMSRTVSVNQLLHTIDHPTHVVTIDTSNDEITLAVPFGVSLVTYDYVKDSVVASRNFPVPGNLKLRRGVFSGKEEVYFADLLSKKIYILDAKDLTIIEEFNTSTSLSDFDYYDETFIISLTDGLTEIRRRDNFNLLATWLAPPVNKSIHCIKTSAGLLRYLEVSAAYFAMYELRDTGIARTAVKTGITGVADAALNIHPQATELVANIYGLVLDMNLDPVGQLDEPEFDHNLITYVGSGNHVASIDVLGAGCVLRFFDPDKEYREVSAEEFAIKPHKIWSDNGKLYSLTHISSPSGLKSVIHTYEIP